MTVCLKFILKREKKEDEDKKTHLSSLVIIIFIYAISSFFIHFLSSHSHFFHTSHSICRILCYCLFLLTLTHMFQVYWGYNDYTLKTAWRKHKSIFHVLAHHKNIFPFFILFQYCMMSFTVIFTSSSCLHKKSSHCDYFFFTPFQTFSRLARMIEEIFLCMESEHIKMCQVYVQITSGILAHNLFDSAKEIWFTVAWFRNFFQFTRNFFCYEAMKNFNILESSCPTIVKNSILLWYYHSALFKIKI